MFHFGFLCPIDLHTTVFVDDGTLYTYQVRPIQYHRKFDIHEDDYYLYLMRKMLNAEFSIDQVERQRFFELKNRRYDDYPDCESDALRINSRVGKLDKRDRRLFEWRENSFWRVRMPLPTNSYLMEDTLSAEPKQPGAASSLSATGGGGGRYIQEHKLTPKRRLAWFEKEVKTLQQQLTAYRVNVSVSAQTLVRAVDLKQALDPLMPFDNPLCRNPWLASERANFEDNNRLTEVHFKIWQSSFTDLLNDPEGVQLFMQFLEKHYSAENLKFWLDVREVLGRPTQAEFYQEAVRIRKTYIDAGSSLELNLDVQTREKIVQTMDQAATQAPALSLTVFDVAMQKTFVLMQTSSYPLFLNSAIFKEAKEKAAMNR